FDDAGIDMLLVGDSIGNTMHGHRTTLPVTDSASRGNRPAAVSDGVTGSAPS
ncbi:3-methyl-2-oxobutanoate hydroxymethyltransferase, partial [Streptomyces albidoflavus]